MTVGERVKVLRIEEKLTQQKLADLLGMDQSNYSKCEHGKFEFNYESLRKLSKIFAVTTDYLLGLED